MNGKLFDFVLVALLLQVMVIYIKYISALVINIISEGEILSPVSVCISFSLLKHKVEHSWEESYQVHLMYTDNSFMFLYCPVSSKYAVH